MKGSELSESGQSENNGLCLYKTKNTDFILDRIRCAKRSICLVFYSFFLDDVSSQFLFLLRQAVTRGVTIKILFDPISSGSHMSQALLSLQTIGVMVKSFRPVPSIWNIIHPSDYLCRQHSRVFLFDDRYFITGSGGISHPYNGRDELFVELELRDSELIHAWFDHLWLSTETPKNTVFRPVCDKEINRGVQTIFSGPNPADQEIHTWFHKQINSTQKKIIIVSPFFAPPRIILMDLVSAAKRGVCVQIITPNHTDRPSYDVFKKYLSSILIPAGVSWLESPAFFHQKYFILDDSWLLGSCNFDILSFRRNYELALTGRGGNILPKLEKLVETDNLKTINEPSKKYSLMPKLWPGVYWLLEKLFSA